MEAKPVVLYKYIFLYNIDLTSKRKLFTLEFKIHQREKILPNYCYHLVITI